MATAVAPGTRAFAVVKIVLRMKLLKMMTLPLK
jgi:hypothetical protein